MKVTPHGTLLYLVQSEHGHPDYLVDLGAYWGNGACDCMHFRVRLEPKMRHLQSRPADWPKYGYMCKHIIASRRSLLQEVIETMALRETEAGQRDYRAIRILYEKKSPVDHASEIQENPCQEQYEAVSYPQTNQEQVH